MTDFLEKKSFSNKFIIDLLVNFLENDKTSINKKIHNTIINELMKNDKTIANKFKRIFNTSDYSSNNLSLRKIDNANLLPSDQNNQKLLRKEDTLSLDEESIIWDENISQSLNQIILEHTNRKKLDKFNLEPTKSLIFHGLPGVGKTLAAQWLSKKLNLPLYILDLATIMSSYLGKSGSNIKTVFEYALANNCILLLDEFDAIGKQRGDQTEIGELKRLVTVLLQAIDSWSANSILIAATNHPELLDKAIWRRFDEIIEFKMPNHILINKLITKKFPDINENLVELLCEIMKYKSHALINKDCLKIYKDMALNSISLLKAISNYLLLNIPNMDLEKYNKIKIATIMINDLKLSQRKASDILHISRDTIRKNL